MKARTIRSQPFKPGTLREAIADRLRLALGCGALRPIQTDQAFLEDGGVQFIIRIVSSLARKDKARPHSSPEAGIREKSLNPFLPYDRGLFVADVSDTHVSLLNKFQVLDHHLLIVTRHFEHQEILLTRADFQALWICLAEFEGLGFYNGGTAAGASQPHKHLQVVPLPLSAYGPGLPIAPLMESLYPRAGRIGRVANFPFRHAAVRLGRAAPARGRVAAEIAHGYYRDLLEAAGVGARGDYRQRGPYNLLVTRDWMLLVPRSKECCRGISVNALGFAGSLFVRNRKEMRIAQTQGAWALLSDVGVTPPLPRPSVETMTELCRF
jgi:ATP adenylyltransferase